MRFRKLRIAWSVVWGVVAVLLLVLWVRSYTWVDDLHVALSGQRYFVIHSMRGSTEWSINTYSPSLNFRPIQTESVRVLAAELKSYGDELIAFQLTRRPVLLPHWAFILAVTTLATISWLPWRFTLRTLLIATTLIAIVLGLIVYSVR